MTTISVSALSADQRSLPTFRCNIDKQIEILKAVVIFHDKNKVPASYKDIAPIADLDPTIVSGTLGFWKDIGILQGETGKYQPSNTLIEVIRQLTWRNEEGAWRIFREAISNAWFFAHLTMAFQIRKEMTPEELISSLGKAAGLIDRDKNTTTSLRNLVALTEIAHVLVRDSNGNFTMSSELTSTKQQTLTVDVQKSIVLVRVGGEVFAINAESLKEFVKSNGKAVDPNQQILV